jgi:hypothetical protein
VAGRYCPPPGQSNVILQTRIFRFCCSEASISPSAMCGNRNPSHDPKETPC